MNTFLKVLQKHQAEIERMFEEKEHGTPLSYPQMQSMGMLKPFAVRLPVTLIAALDEIAKHGLWRSKQEMVYDMIQSAYLDFFNASSDATKEKLRQTQEEALSKIASKVGASAVSGAPEKSKKSEKRAKSKKAKRA